MKTTTRTAIGITLIVLIGLTSWALAGTLKEQKYINLGEAECQKGNYEAAIALFSAGIDLNPDNHYLYNDRGLSYLEKGDKDEAISDFSKAIELKPDFAEAYYNRGLAYFKQGRGAGYLPNAISDFTKAIELKSDYAVEAYYNRGLTYNSHYNRGSNYDKDDTTDYHAKAVADFDTALALDPTYVLAYAGKGNAAYRNKEYAKAVEYFTKALESENQIIQKAGNKGLAGVYASKARALKAAEDYDKSIADYNKALALDPELGTALGHQASNYLIVGEYYKAIELYDTTIELYKNDPTYKHMYSKYQGKGDCYYNLGEYDKAIGMYDKAIEECAKNYPSRAYRIYAGIGNVHLALEEYDKAMENYNKVIELAEKEDSYVANAYKGLGTAYKELGEKAKAREALEKAKALYEEYGEEGHGKSENIEEIQKLLSEL
ncbi:MAG: tetratricopeptide repeat protein [Methanophagales archaeon]|nr:tetratricopeptide repeat protein [Methanophagales archaeon]